MRKRDQNKIISVIKANGQTELFDESKIRQSLVRSGAEPEIIDIVITETRKKIYSNIPTQKLYRIVFNELRKRHRPTAGKYHLKKAIMELGPTGFPFEKYIAEIFKAAGYLIQTGKIVPGHCVKHEVDVIAQNEKEQFMMECKFHSDPGTVCNVKQALYVSAPFQDIERKLKNESSPDTKLFKGWLVTNTRMTTDAEQYGICSRLELMSWNFPGGKSLRERIDESGLHPVTCITALSRSEKEQLLNKNIVLCRSLYMVPEVLQEIEITELRAKRIIKEAENIFQTKKNTL